MRFTILLSLVFAAACDAAPEPVANGMLIRACAPPSSLCSDLEGECLAAGVDDERCAVLAQGICPADKCTACQQAQDACAAGGGECDAIEALCDAALGACSCVPTCRPTTTLTLPQLLATCFGHPWTLDEHCDDPSVGQCFAVLQWKGCNITSCEYVECAEDIALADECSPTIPSSCAAVLACGDAEEAP
jgi:hypothetical protein